MRYWIQSFCEDKGYKEIFIENDAGHIVSFLTFGARINRWRIPLNVHKKSYDDIILGYENYSQLMQGINYYYGATTGPVAGRIKKGKFNLNGTDYYLPPNDGINHLHGGNAGFDRLVFDFNIIESDEEIKIIFKLPKEDYPEYYLGSVRFAVVHCFNNSNEWRIEYQAEATEDSLFNPTNHVYFNLNGNNQRDILNHIVQVDSSYYLPLSSDSIPLGQYKCSSNSIFDLKKGRALKEIVESNDYQIRLFEGLDHPFLLDHREEYSIRVICPEKCREVRVKTASPCVVLYSHNKIDPPMKIWGNKLVKYSGLAIETQKVPDAINQPQLEQDIVIRKNEICTLQTTYSYKDLR